MTSPSYWLSTAAVLLSGILGEATRVKLAKVLGFQWRKNPVGRLRRLLGTCLIIIFRQKKPGHVRGFLGAW